MLQQIDPKRRYKKFKRREITTECSYPLVYQIQKPENYIGLFRNIGIQMTGNYNSVSKRRYIKFRSGEITADCSETSVYKIRTSGRWKYSETSAHKTQAQGNHPKERTQHSKHGTSLRSKSINVSHRPTESRKHKL
jgi:hypothetical protein